MKKYFKYILDIALTLIVLMTIAPIVNASDTITYRNSSIFRINNEHNSVEIYPGPDNLESSDNLEIIHNAPISLRSKLKTSYISPEKRYNVTVSNSNNFVSISKASDAKNIFEKTSDNLSTTYDAMKKPDSEMTDAGNLAMIALMVAGIYGTILNGVFKRK